jgi:uncharacterized protein (TIGR00369 family)
VWSHVHGVWLRVTGMLRKPIVEGTGLTGDRTAHLAFVRRFMDEEIPFNREIGIKVVELSPGRAVLGIAYRPALIGDPVRPALHGGVISALADTCGGAAVWTAIGDADRCSTIDIRIDYLRPGRLETLHAAAEVLRVGNRVGVTSIRLYHPARPDEVVAEGKGVYSVKRAEDR